MKHLALPAALAMIGLTACSADMTAGERQAIVDAALIAIDDLEASGLNYVEATPEMQNRILTACALAPLVLAASAGADVSGQIRDACIVLRRAAE